MKHNSLTLLLAAAMMMLIGVQAAKAQKQGSTAEGKVKVVLHMAGNQTFECSISQLDSITFVGDDLIIEEEHEWVDLGLPSGTLWATCNVGANSPEEYGDYFAWGETEPKSVYNWSNYKWCKGDYNTITKYCWYSGFGYNGFSDQLIELLPEDDAATANWGSGWQMPSQSQCTELMNSSYTTTTWTTQNNVDGMMIVSKSNGNTLFLPAAGTCYSSGPAYVGSNGYYWSTLLDRSRSDSGYLLYFPGGRYYTSSETRCYGRSVRPVRVKTR